MCTGFALPGLTFLEEARVSAIPAINNQNQVLKRSKGSMRTSPAKRRLSKTALEKRSARHNVLLHTDHVVESNAAEPETWSYGCLTIR